MAGRLRYFREINGSYFTRIAVPKELQPFLKNKEQLQEGLGRDRRRAEALHHAVVAKFQAQIADARRRAAQAGMVEAKSCEFPLTPEQIALSHYKRQIALDEEFRYTVPGYALIGLDDGRVNDVRMGMAGQLNNAELARVIGQEIERYRLAGNHDAAVGSPEWRTVGRALCIAEYEAMERFCERDEGIVDGQPKHPVLTEARMPEPPAPAIPIKDLFRDYIESRQVLGKHRDGGANWESALADLIKFLGHSDARKITRRNLIDWRDGLIRSGKSPKTVADKYLASVRAILRWAFEQDRLPSNEAEKVRQEVPKRSMTREKGYTTEEATKILRAAISYQPKTQSNPANRESAPVSAAKRWAPLLCAFSGARVSEVCQVRKQDIRQEGDVWVMRLTADAGSLKSGDYRDVPLHPQVVRLGFIDFVKGCKDGALFHAAKDPAKFLGAAQTTAAKVGTWLHKLELVPKDVQPNHAWRHRFKTLGLELEIAPRVIDAIQGHAGRTAGDGYGDVTLKARIGAIWKLPEYDLDFETEAGA